MLTGNAAMTKQLTQALVLVRKTLATRNHTIANAVFEGLKSLFALLADAKLDLQEFPDRELADCCATVFNVEDFAESARVRAAEAALKLAPLCTERPRLDERFGLLLSQAIQRERSQSVQHILKEIAKLRS